MTRPTRPFAERLWAVGAVTAAGLAYATLASITHPFTEGAELVTAVPLVTAVVAMAVRTVTTRRSAVAVRSVQMLPQPDTGANRRSLAWITMLVVISGWEVYCYASAPRSEHPTLSTFIDLLDSTRAGKAVGFALWLALGCYLVWQ